MVDIQSLTAEIRPGKRRRRRRQKSQGKNIMSASAMQGGHNKVIIAICKYTYEGPAVAFTPQSPEGP